MKNMSDPKIDGVIYRIGMAFEDNEYYRRHVDGIKRTLDNIHIEVLYVNKDNEILWD